MYPRQVITVVAAGGTPWARYGLGGGSDDEMAAEQFKLAQEHGFVLDLLPLLFFDFGSHIIKMGAAVGACLLAKLAQREAGRCRVDAVMFGCKGTMAAALGSGAFLKRHLRRARKDGGKEDVDVGAVAITAPVALVGMGTDLAQGFVGEEPPFPGEMWAHAPLLVLNSLQDDAVGAGKATVDATAQRVRRQGGGATAEWYDIDGWYGGRQEGRPNPGHNWYNMAFAPPGNARQFDPKRVSALKQDMLAKMAALVKASPR
jgi:hypothetical protein